MTARELAIAGNASGQVVKLVLLNDDQAATNPAPTTLVDTTPAITITATRQGRSDNLMVSGVGRIYRDY